MSARASQLRRLIIEFGVEGKSDACHQAGWSHPEPGYTWTTGTHSAMRIALPLDWPGENDTVLELTLYPFVNELRDAQRLSVAVDGHEIGRETLRDICTLGYRVPARLVRPGGDLNIDLHHPDAHSPGAVSGGDMRLLAMMVRRVSMISLPRAHNPSVCALPPIDLPQSRDAINRILTQRIGLGMGQLAGRFESLGRNCEFGLLQVHLGLDRDIGPGIGLFRFSSINLNNLLVGLHERFERIGETLTFEGAVENATGFDLIMREKSYGMILHASAPPGAQALARMQTRAPASLRLRSRLLLERIANGDRIFVVQARGQIARPLMLPLLTALRGIGDAALLIVDQSPLVPRGAVEKLEYGLYHGKLDVLAPEEDSGQSDVPGWASILANAYILARLDGFALGGAESR